jgi:hypothetical protein
MNIDPKWGFYIGLVMTIIGVLSNSQTLIHTLLPSQEVANMVVAWSNFILTVGTAVMTYIHAFSSNDVGPLVTKAPK